VTDLAVQDRHAPHNACFGCGPANAEGLQIKSFPAEGGGLVCDWTASPHHQAFPGMLNGGIVGALLDCHSNWAACMHLMERSGAASPPCTVTASYSVTLRRPTPLGPVRLVARVTESSDDRATVEATLEADGKVCATCTGLFVAVKEGHPAYHRW